MQESEGLATLIGQLAESEITIRLHTDSSSARAVLLNRGLSRRVRHLDIAVCYLQERIQEAQTLKVMWCPTAGMIADVLTKCLNHLTFCQHQRALGIYPDENVQQVWKICLRRRIGWTTGTCQYAGATGRRVVESEAAGQRCDDVFENCIKESEISDNFSDLSESPPCCTRSMDLWSTCRNSGSSTTEASPGLEVVPEGEDDRMGTERSSEKTMKGAEMEAPFWCKPCKWLFRSDRASGLGWTDENGCDRLWIGRIARVPFPRGREREKGCRKER